VQLPDGLVVGALAVVNAFGFPVDAVTGALLGSAFVPAGLPRPPVPTLEQAARVTAHVEQARTTSPIPRSPLNTTVAVVATNGRLDPARARRTATAAHSGLARALDPAHTLVDGDAVFTLATGELPVPDDGLVAVQSAAATALLLAILDGVLAATSTRTPALAVPSYAAVLTGTGPPASPPGRRP
jgi:L-aminopeptidase/D-esterase-like protein